MGTEYCSFCEKATKFGHNVTCNGCFIEKKYYFDVDGKMKYYQYCDECTFWINDDIDIMDDDISSISRDPYQQLINDIDYTEYQSIDHYYYSVSNESISKM